MIYEDSLRIEPISCPRPRIATRGRFAHAYYPAAYKKWQEDFKELFNSVSLSTIDVPVFVLAEFVVTKPKTTKLKTPKGDIDNYVKSLLDGLTAVGMWTDDTLVSHVMVFKRFTEPHETAHINLCIDSPSAYPIVI